MTRYLATLALATGLAIAALAGLPRANDAREINVYSYRQPFLVEKLFADFTKETGISVKVIYAKSGLIERIAREGANSPADLLLTTDIGRLTGAVERQVSQAVSSPILDANIPPEYRDPAGHWFGLTRRARVIYASRARVSQRAITYEELALPKWRGRICSRSGQHVYSIALIASMIAHHGEAKARVWLDGVKANLARRPAGNDRAQVKSVYAGECDIALVNTYYMGAMMTNTRRPEQAEWAKSVRILFPNTKGRGTHINLSGVVLARHAPHRADAVKLMEWLSGEKAQRIYADINFEYPVAPGVPWSDIVQSWGNFKADKLALSTLATLRKRASELVDEVGFNQ
ncbi:MAG: Fe(3+) ABC transporter substrate-binding protein [Alphaproteobacteria bacterium]